MELEDIEYKIANLHLSPGDILVIKCNCRAPMEMFERIKRYVEAHTDITNKVLIIDDLIDLSVLTKAEIEAKAS